MRFRDYAVAQVMVGLHRIGIVGLHDALKEVEDAGLTDREAIVGLVMAHLQGRNYIPEHLTEPYRVTVWREFLRHRGEAFDHLFTEIQVTVKGPPGHDRDRFVALVTAVLAGHELRPAVSYAAPDPTGPNPQLVIGEVTVARGVQSRRALEAAVRATLSHW